MITFEIPFKKSVMPPALSKIGGITYIIPGFIEVPNETVLTEVYNQWVPWFTKNFLNKENENINDQSIKEKVKSSSSNKTYEVIFNNGTWWCDCVGFEFRRTCKHVTQTKLKYNLK